MCHKAPCARCKQHRIIRGRRICHPCYKFCQDTGTLDDYPRLTRTLAGFVEDYQELTKQGLSLDVVAARMGYKNHHCVRRMVSRARAANLLPPYRPPVGAAMAAGAR